MKILMLEDDAAILRDMKKRMEEQGHSVVDCSGIYHANDYIKNEDNIDLFVVDLNMSPIGLSEEQTLKSQGGVLTGWTWLTEYVFNKNNDKKSIIFSSFIDELKDYLERTPEEQKYLQNVTLIKKSNIDASFIFENTVNSIAAIKKEQNNINKSIFLSFSSRDSDIADIIEQRLQRHYGKQISISRWERDVKYKGSFRKFMDSLRDHDFVLSIISDQYLKSRACMYEVGKIIDEPSFQNKLHYIVLSDDDKKYYKTCRTETIAAKVYDLNSHFDYLLYWKKEYETLSCHADGAGMFVVNPEHKSLINETYKIINDIQKFLSYIYDARGIPFSQLMDTDFKVIKDAIDIKF